MLDKEHLTEQPSEGTWVHAQSCLFLANSSVQQFLKNRDYCVCAMCQAQSFRNKPFSPHIPVEEAKAEWEWLGDLLRVPEQERWKISAQHKALLAFCLYLLPSQGIGFWVVRRNVESGTDERQDSSNLFLGIAVQKAKCFRATKLAIWVWAHLCQQDSLGMIVP